MKTFLFPAILPVLLLSSCAGSSWLQGESLSVGAFKALPDTSARYVLSAELVSVEDAANVYVFDGNDYLYVCGLSPLWDAQPGNCIVFSASKGTLNGRAAALEAELIRCSPGTYPGFRSERAAAGWLELPFTQPEKNMVFLSHKGGPGGRNYSVWYNTADHVARWVCYPLCKGDTGAGRSNAYAFDPLLDEALQADLRKSYQNRKKGGEEYIRGHLIPSFERTGRENMDVFLSTNIIPQSSALNSGLWSSLETAERSWSASCDTLYIVAGTLTRDSVFTVSDNSSPKKGITVPDSVYKVFLALLPDGSYKALAAIFPNSSCPSKKFSSGMAISVDELEEMTGEDFFSKLPSLIEDAVESADPARDSWWWSLI